MPDAYPQQLFSGRWRGIVRPKDNGGDDDRDEDSHRGRPGTRLIRGEDLIVWAVIALALLAITLAVVLPH